jgi:uncharacterized membrane protein
MIKKVAGIIVGYVAMAVFIFATFSVAYLLMGADIAFNPGSFEPSMTWVVISFVLGFIAAVIGGLVCAALSKNARAAQVLAGLVLVLGLLLAIPALRGNDTRPNVRDGSVSNMDAMQKARTPGWVALINPFIGAAGILIGARLRRQPEAGT